MHLKAMTSRSLNPHSTQLVAPRFAAACRLGGLFALFAGAWLISAGSADAGVMISPESISAGMSAPQTPEAPEPTLPLIDGQSPSDAMLGLGSTNGGGMNSQNVPQGIHGFSAAGMLVADDASTNQSLVLRLVISRHLLLPAPLEDRFFRPPRCA